MTLVSEMRKRIFYRKVNSENVSLLITGGRIHFVYCFVVDLGKSSVFFDKNRFDATGFNRGIPWSRKGWLPTVKASTMLKNQGFSYLDENANVYDSYDSKSAAHDMYFSGDKYQIRDSSNNSIIPGLRVSLSRLMRIRSSGAGSLTISFKLHLDENLIDSEMSYKLLKHVMQLAPSVWSGLTNASDVTEIDVGKENTLVADNSNKAKSIKLDDLFVESIDLLQKKFNAKLFYPDMLQSGETQSLSERFRGIHVPYLYADLTTDKDLHQKVFCAAADNGGVEVSRFPKICKQLGGLLMRCPFIDEHDRISLGFLNREIFHLNAQRKRKISSINFDRNLFANISKSAAVSICVNRDIASNRIMLASMIDMIEGARLRWHVLVVLNLWLDGLLVDIRTERDFREDFLEIHRVREVLASQIGDPYTYLHDGHLGLDMVSLAYERFQVKTLSEAVQMKTSILDSIAANKEYAQALIGQNKNEESSFNEKLRDLDI